MNTQALASLAIVGVAVSLFMQWLKQHLDTLKTQVVVVILSVVFGVAYYFLQMHTNLLVNILAILGTADVVYAYFLQYFEKPPLGGRSL